MSNVVAAVDCGATSVRVCRVDLEAPRLEPQIVHRVAHSPRRDTVGHLRWDWDLITGAVVEGLERVLEQGPLASIGVDTWAVDYGLLDDRGALVGAPFAYRDHRTDGYRSIVDTFGAARMYRINGLQLQPFNTIFQLAVHARDELRRAARLLWLPELIVHHLTGVAVTERTSAGSSGLVDVTSGQWSPELLDVAGVEATLLGDITAAARVVGTWRDVPVTLVGGHDTASAVAGMGRVARRGSSFVATGTWVLTGVERAAPDLSDWARAGNYTNEAGALGGFRFLRNVAGFWLLEQCRAAWGATDVATLVAAAERVHGDVPIVDVDDPELLSPADMLGTYTALAGLARDANPGLITRSIMESIVARTASTLAELAEAATFDDVVVFGGAARMDFLVRLLAQRTGREVRVGPAEASAAGNAIVQGIAIGAFRSLDEGRSRLGGPVP